MATHGPAAQAVNTAFWCERVRTCFSLFTKNPSTLQHLLLFGPPGSGKTTSAAWLVDQIWSKRKSLMCMSMNAADERSLESIRQKVFPFLRVDWRTGDERSPRFLILDECETLTEAAQLSLQTILDMPPTDVCVILICNSQSRIHPKLRQRLLRIRYDPPSTTAAHKPLSYTITRGDLRLTGRSESIESRIWQYLNAHPASLPALLADETIDLQGILTEIILLASMFASLDAEMLGKINSVYPLLTDGTALHEEISVIILGILADFRAHVAAAAI